MSRQVVRPEIGLDLHDPPYPFETIGDMDQSLAQQLAGDGYGIPVVE
jgi:hypothetical protein